MMRKPLSLIGGTAVCLICWGCSRAPSVGIIGSFFPVWMICLLAGVLAAFVGRAILMRFRLESSVQPLWVFYPSFVTLFACLLWLIFFR